MAYSEKNVYACASVPWKITRPPANKISLWKQLSMSDVG